MLRKSECQDPKVIPWHLAVAQEPNAIAPLLPSQGYDTSHKANTEHDRNVHARLKQCE